MKLIDTWYNWKGVHVVKETLDRAPLLLYFEGVTDVAWRIPPCSTNILLQACGLGGFLRTVSIAMNGPLVLPWSQDYEGCKLYKAMFHRERIITAILQLTFYHGNEKEQAQFTCQPVEFYTSNLNDAPSSVKEAFVLLTGHNVSPCKAVQSFVTDATRALLDIGVRTALGMYGKPFKFNTDQSIPKQPKQEPEHEPIEAGAAHSTQQEQYAQAKPSTRCATRTPSKWEQASKVQMLISQKERLLILETMHGAVNTVQRVLDYDLPPKNGTTATGQVAPAATSVAVPLQSPTPTPTPTPTLTPLESKATSFSHVDELSSALKNAQERIRRLALMLEVKTSENLEMNEKFARHGSNFSKRKGHVGQKGKAKAKRISIQARGKHDKAKKININQRFKIDHNRSTSRPPFK